MTHIAAIKDIIGIKTNSVSDYIMALADNSTRLRLTLFTLY